MREPHSPLGKFANPAATQHLPRYFVPYPETCESTILSQSLTSPRKGTFMRTSGQFHAILLFLLRSQGETIVSHRLSAAGPVSPSSRLHLFYLWARRAAGCGDTYYDSRRPLRSTAHIARSSSTLNCLFIVRSARQGASPDEALRCMLGPFLPESLL